MLSRRNFLAASATAVATPLFAIDPIKRPAKPEIKLSLAAYSFRKALDLKKPTMTLFEFIDMAATLPLDGVELTSYFLAETTNEYLDKVKAHCAAKKLAISGMPIRSTFTIKDDAKRKVEIEQVKQWVKNAARLGAPTVRIFAGALAKGEKLAEVQDRVVAAIEECCKTAKEHGVLLALENHHGVTDTAEQVLTLVQAVKSDAFGVNIDTGNFKTVDPYADIAKIAPYGVVCQVKTEVFPEGKPKVEADLARVVKILRDAKYNGYIALEHEADEDPKVAVPKYIKQLRALLG
ncbi:sugar phosphate isomerase/epimerase [soil metagenome]